MFGDTMLSVIGGGRRTVITTMPRQMTCQDCGCTCTSCLSTNNLDLHHEIEELRAAVKDSSAKLTQAESEFSCAREYADSEAARLTEELAKLRDRYERLLDSHKKMQRVNHNLEEKLLSIVTKCETEKRSMEEEVSQLTSKLVDAKVSISDMEEENERYRSDCNMAVKLLQCKPSNFVAHKLNTLPLDLQDRVRSQLSGKQLCALEEAPNNNSHPTDQRMIRVPMPTFPPTAMVYSLPKQVVSVDPTPDTVPMTVIAHALAQPEASQRPRRIYVCQKCHCDFIVMHKETQTVMTYGRDSNGHHGHGIRSGHHNMGQAYPGPGVHRPRTSSTETEI